MGDHRLELFPERTITDDLTAKVEVPAVQLGTGFEQDLKALERNEATDTENPGWTGLALSLQRSRQLSQSEAIVDSMDLGCCVGASFPEQVAAEIRFDRDEFRRATYFPQEIILSQIRHEILAVRGDAKRNARDFLHEKCRMCGAIRKMDVKMIDPVTGEKLGKIGGISGPQRSLEARSVLTIMTLNQAFRPAFRS